MSFCPFLTLLLALNLTPEAEAPTPMTLADCVDAALSQSAAVEEAEALVSEYRARLAEVESVFYPKLTALVWFAPMFTVEGSALERDVTRRWSSLSDWGPSTHLEAMLVQPIYTFGRASDGKDAARERWKVEEARLREARNTVAREVKRLYNGYLYASSMLPTLDLAQRSVTEAVARAEELFEQGEGKVNQADLSRLKVAAAEVVRYREMALEGRDLALAALKHTMGWEEDRVLIPASSRLEPPRNPPDLDLETARDLAGRNRPEWDQVKHGLAAAQALERAERGAYKPTVFIAGTFGHSWTPTRDDTDNPYHYDVYNDLSGGVAVGLLLNLDLAQAIAKGDQASAITRQIQAKARFAATGIPLQVTKAHGEVLRHHRMIEVEKTAVTEARKWMTFAGAAYSGGIGEAKDLMEGLAAYVKTRQDYYETLRAYYDALADLEYAVGLTLAPEGESR